MAIIVYSTPTCPYCTMLKQFLSEKGVEFEAVDVSTDTVRAQEMIDKSGQMGVPVADINGEIIVGFNKEAVEAALAKGAGAKKAEEAVMGEEAEAVPEPAESEQ